VTRKALIVGAGIGGLAAGVALQRAGWQVSIHERAANPRELGFGLLLAPNALAALSELGVADGIARAGAAMGGVEIRTLDGRVTRRFNAQLGGPAVVALRPELHGALLQAVGASSLTVSSEAISFADDGQGVSVTFAGGGLERADVLIGADGVGSVIRKQLHPIDPPPRPSGFSALRGVAFGAGRHLGALSAVGYLDDGVEAATARAGSDAVYWYVSLIAHELKVPRSPAAILAVLRPRFEAPLAAILDATQPDDMRFDELFQREPLQRWGAGRVTLLGDAAHPMLPHTGQGAAQSLEDAVALGLALSGADAIDQALRRYERVRGRRTRRFVRLGPRIARMTTTRSALIRTARTIVLRLIPEPLVRISAATSRGDPHLALRRPGVH
jgi:2-polyprenyl-6-methoxyphenol hydroxylase-like FAD-dependent oxidoreductase